jgi:ADP-heptose:LPS heptosyltransferase
MAASRATLRVHDGSAADMTVLLYRPLGLGDFLTAVPAYRGVIRATGSQERVVLAASAQLAPLVPLVGGISRLAPTAEHETPRRISRPVTLAVDMHGRELRARDAIDGLSPSHLIGFRCAGRGQPGPEWRDEEHDVDRWVRLLAAGSIPARRDDLRLDPPPFRPPRVRAVVIHPGASSAGRRWSEDRFARLAATLARTGLDVVITGLASERALAERVARRAALPSTAVLAGRLDLGTMAALVATASLVVCGDTGIAHLATAFATPSVVLFGPTSPELWGPLTDGPHTVLEPAHEERHGAGPLHAITVEEVTAAALDRLEPAA